VNFRVDTHNVKMKKCGGTGGKVHRGSAVFHNSFRRIYNVK
jgi:hypothetical protein